MATKSRSAPAAKKSEPAKATVAKFLDPPDTEKAGALAKMALRPSVNAAAVMVEYTKPLGEQDIGALVHLLSGGIEDMKSGDMTRAEGMLYGQAHALQAIFMSLARRAANQEYLKQWEAYLRLALKAQGQCRATLETLAAIKNPPVVFARQANINNGGQQQVNNGTRDGVAHAPAANSVTEQTGLLEASNGQGLDAGTAGPASGADPHLETVGTVHRPPHRRG